MRRFEVRRFPSEPLNGQNPYVLILQARAYGDLPSVVVAPLERAQRPRIPVFEIPVTINDAPYFVLVQELSAEPKHEIGELMLTARHLEWDIGRALDQLLFGA